MIWIIFLIPGKCKIYSISLFSNKATWQNNSVWSQITKFIGHAPMEWGSRGNNEERFAIAAKKVSLMLRPSLCSARCCQTDQFALHYTWLIATAFHHHHQQQQGYHRPPPSNLYSPGIVFWPARASEMWRRANQFVILLAKHNKAFNGLISGYDGPASDSSPASPHTIECPIPLAAAACCWLGWWLLIAIKGWQAGRP